MKLQSVQLWSSPTFRFSPVIALHSQSPTIVPEPGFLIILLSTLTSMILDSSPRVCIFLYR
jgi:hypothetical protein